MARSPLALAVLALAAIVLAAPARADVAGETRQLAELLEIGSGSVVADVGAGDGKWTEALASAVGPEGHVYSTEVEQALVEDLEQRLERRGLDNTTAVLGGQDESGLPAGCCDAILLRMVYHHFENPTAMRISLREALLPGGRLAIVDIPPQRHWRRVTGVPDRGGHGIAPEDLVSEMTADGFELLSRHDDWNSDEDRFCLLFRRIPATP